MGTPTNDISVNFDVSLFWELGGFTPDYSVLEQSCCLASHLLTCGAIDLYLKRNVFPGKVHTSVNPSDLSKTVLQDDLGSDMTTPQDKAAMVSGIAHLGNNMHFDVSNDIQGGATTEQIGDDDIVLSECPNGFKSIFHISRKMYDKLIEAMQTPPDVPHLLMLRRFSCAVALTHLRFAQPRSRQTQPKTISQRQKHARAGVWNGTRTPRGLRKQ